MSNILVWIVLGAVVGIIINITDEKPSIEVFIITLVLGILGALLGGFLSMLILDLGVGGFNLTALMIAILGSFFALLVRRAFGSI